MLLYKAGTRASHRAPDGLSRNPEERDFLNLARTSEWNQYKKAIRGVADTIDKGEFDAEDPPDYHVNHEEELPECLELLRKPAEKCVLRKRVNANAKCKVCSKIMCWSCIEDHPCNDTNGEGAEAKRERSSASSRKGSESDTRPGARSISSADPEPPSSSRLSELLNHLNKLERQYYRKLR